MPSWRFKVLLFLILGAMTLAGVGFDLRYNVTGPDINLGEWQFSRKNQEYIDQAGGEVRLSAGAQLNRYTGEVTLKNARLTPVTQISYYSWIKGLMLSAWGLFFYTLVKAYVGMCSPGVRRALVLCFAVILTGTTIPDEVRDWVLRWGGVEVPGGGLSSVGFWGLALDEWLHFLGFTLFGVVLFFLTPQIPIWLTCLCLVMFSFGTEMVQVFVESRTAKVFDGLINLSGWLLGAGCVLIYRWISELKDGYEEKDG